MGTSGKRKSLAPIAAVSSNPDRVAAAIGCPAPRLWQAGASPMNISRYRSTRAARKCASTWHR